VCCGRTLTESFGVGELSRVDEREGAGHALAYPQTACKVAPEYRQRWLPLMGPAECQQDRPLEESDGEPDRGSGQVLRGVV
jgi:hypothetical protein